MPDHLPKHARVVVVGGGIIGCSVAYHLAKMGCREVVLLERDRLTSGTTWHAAGLIVTFGSTSETSTEMRKYTRDLYARLEAETGLATGFEPVGFIEVAADQDRLEEYRRVSAFNRHCGVDVQEISPREIHDLFPLARTDDLLAGFYVKGDGRANPVDVTMALAKGARLGGVTVLENTPVTEVLVKNGAVRGVRTPLGDIEAEVVVNCTGMWARQLGEQLGVVVPLQAAEHYYLITDKIPGLSKSFPVLEDPSSYGYFREEVGGLMVGLFEPVCAPWNVGRVPDDFSFGEIPPDWDRMGPYVEKAMRRVPASLEVGVRKFFCGPESFTPDLAPVVGEAPEVRNYFVAAGMNSIGILTGGGLGRVLAHWILTGRPDVDITGFDIARLHRYQSNPEYRRVRTVESLGMVYQCHYPTRSMMTARGAKRSALHDRLATNGAYFKDVSGWEGPDWFAPYGVEPRVEKLSFGRQNWFPYWQAEHQAAREGVIVMDMSFMSKFLVQGRDAGRLLEHLSANRVDGPKGVITYTQWLDEAGGIEADLTVTKLDDDRFLVVASDTAHRHVEAWMRRHFPADAHVFVTDVTSAYAQINVQGPRSRELLQGLTTTDLRNEAFPFRTAREIDVGFARVLCGAHHLPRRARLRALRADRAGAARVRADRRGGPPARSPPRRPQGPREPPHGEGLSRLRARHRQHRRRPLRRPRVRRRPHEALPRARGGARQEGRRSAHAPPLAGAREGPGAPPVPRRDRAPRRRRGGLRARGLLRLHARRRGGARDDRRARGAARRGVDRGRHVGGRRRGPRYPAVASLRPLYDPDMRRVRS